MTYLDPHDPRPEQVYTLADARSLRKVAAELKAKRCWHDAGTPGRRALEHNIATNEFLADLIDVRVLLGETDKPCESEA